ncbi:hypothetical protein DFA_02864 [Cavenderia fasciculata]|uniref:Ankyrin repeat-containing protein n=1 Tax=Cavenderia fasciculata TaxID=261658 RepID=F4PIP0_CACFS|nr:uncharacterized protein DFA_02864 [Cavenderia fasciculata]EGG24620.1 hypothetical protein DFA_02864 [Cavenderia fasciculata]|eukprot:XP_004362471.1 hypothetical protein DFA_02864 [Cavenderia fasciculata]
MINNTAHEKVLKNRYLLKILLKLVQQNNRRQQIQSYRYNELNNLEWILENGYEGLLKMIFDKGELEQRLSVSTKAVELFFTRVKDRQLLLSIYNQHPLLFCRDDTIKWACSRGDVEIVKMLVKQTKPLALQLGDLSLYAAIQSNSIELVKYIAPLQSKTIKIAIVCNTSNKEMIEYVFDQVNGGRNRRKLINVDLLINQPTLFNWAITSYPTECVWSYKSSTIMPQIIKEVYNACQATDPKQYLANSKIPFKDIYNAVREIIDRKKEQPKIPLVDLEQRMIKIDKDNDPIYYPMAIVLAFDDSHQVIGRFLRYLVKTDHPFLYSLAGENIDFVLCPTKLSFPDDIHSVTTGQAKLFYFELALPPINCIDSVGLFDFVYDNLILKMTEEKRVMWVVQVFDNAINQCNHALVQYLSQKLPETASIKWSFNISREDATIQDIIDMSKLLTDTGHFANSFSQTVISNISHPTLHLTEYILKSLSTTTISLALPVLFYCQNDYLLKAIFDQTKESVTLDSILNAELSDFIIRYRPDNLKSVLTGEIHEKHGERISIGWNGIHMLLKSICMFRNLDLLKYLLDLIRNQKFIEDPIDTVASMVAEFGTVEFIQYIICRYRLGRIQLTSMQKTACSKGNLENFIFLIEQTELDPAGFVRYTHGTNKSNYQMHRSAHQSILDGEIQVQTTIQVAAYCHHLHIIEYLYNSNYLFHNSTKLHVIKKYLLESCTTKTTQKYISKLKDK